MIDNQLNDTDFNEVDLGYTFMVDPEKCNVYIKFNGFEDEEQMEQFVNYMSSYIPLIFSSSTKH